MSRERGGGGEREALRAISFAFRRLLPVSGKMQVSQDGVGVWMI